MKSIVVFSMSLLLMGACKKKEDSGATTVDITFSVPTSGDTILSYNQVHAEGTITADGNMKGYAVYLMDAQTSAVLYSNVYEVEAEAYNFHEHWTNNLSDTTTVTVRVEVTKDKEGNKITSERNVVCFP